MPRSDRKQPQSARHTTMADVARLAGVGKMTVSRVLSGSANVSKETADRVQQVIRTLKYQPNELARSLRSVHSKTIAVILPYLYDPFFATCAHAVSTVAAKHDYSVLITTSDEKSDVEQKQAALLLRRRIDGMLIIPAPQDSSYLGGEMFSRLHVVTLDRTLADSRFDSVVVDNQAGARSAIAHLISHGHREIAFLGLAQTLFTMQARYAGYKEAMLHAGMSPEPYVECMSAEEMVEAVRALLARAHPPTALFAGNNLTMRRLLRALNVLDVAVPDDLALAGFDDFDVADVLQPALTVVRQPVYPLGEAAANLLFERIEHDAFPTIGRRITLPTELVIRRSCGCVPPLLNEPFNRKPSARLDPFDQAVHRTEPR